MWTPPDREFPGYAAAVKDADALISCDLPSLAEFKTVNQVKIGKAGGCGIEREILSAGELPPVHSDVFRLEYGDRPDRQEMGRCSKLEGKASESNVWQIECYPSLYRVKVLSPILVGTIRQKLLTHQRHEQSSSRPDNPS